MHKSARRFGRLFFETYALPPGSRILDVGSLVVESSEAAANELSGSLRDFAPAATIYIGADLVAGPGVDVVVSEPGTLPFDDGHFQAIVSTSCFEHDVAFWITFQEMARVTAPGGFIYINAPSNGAYHRYPLDCWRFYPDAGFGLAAWACRAGFDVALLESFTGAQEEDQWNDCVMIFARGPAAAGRRLTDLPLGPITNVHRPDRSPDPACFRVTTQDQLLAAAPRPNAALLHAPPQAPSPPRPAPPRPAARGWMDQVHPRWAAGWVASPDAVQPALVLAWLDGAIIGTAIADGPRADLVPIGAGRSAFAMRLRLPVYPQDVGTRLWFEALLNGTSLGEIPPTPELLASCA